jgi:tryptophan 2,3-dioxygenase
MARPPLAYWDYIKVEELLALQAGVESSEDALSNDEVMFIVVHQIDELWFKLVLRELISVRNLFKRPIVPEQSLASAVRGIRRMTVLFEKLATHFEVMETMTTRDYLGFRDKLSPASGFQSSQLREIEILLGLSDEERIPLGHEHSYMEALKNADGSPSSAYLRVETILQDKPNLRDAIHDWLYRTPIQGSTPDQEADAEVVAGFLESYLAAVSRESRAFTDQAVAVALTDADRERLEGRHLRSVADARTFLSAAELPEVERAKVSRIRAALVFVESYRELPLLAFPREVIDAIVALEQTMLVFRQRHARMVERVIGRRTGTGGSAGVDYLDQTALRYRVFREMWAVRTLLLPEHALPKLEHPELYGFKLD